MGIFERQKRIEETVFEGDFEQTEEKLDKNKKNREKIAQEMIKENHPLAQKIKDIRWIKKTIAEYGNLGSLKKNTELACEKTSKETGYEPQLVMDIHKILQKAEEKEQQEQEKRILEERRREGLRKRGDLFARL